MLIELLIDDDSLDPVRTGSFFILKKTCYTRRVRPPLLKTSYSIRFEILLFFETIYLVLERLESLLA